MVIGVCSNKPRPRLQTTRYAMGSKLGDNAKDPWHVRKSGMATLCGIDCSEWLTIGDIEPDHHLCDRCRKKLP